MATFLITVVRANSDNQYVLIYDSSVPEIQVTKHGSAPDDLTVTESELGYTNGQLRYEACIGDDKHTIHMSTSYPFATFSVSANDPSCVVVPPTPPTDPPPNPTTENYIAYQVKFKNFESQMVEANIFDQDTYAVGREIEYRKLKPSGEPVRIECIDNDEDKFTPIRAKQCIIEFLSTNQINLNTFANGQDNRWYVEVKAADQIKFKGYLVLNDLQEDFLSPPNVVSLTAIDGLGLLKDIPLTDFNGVSPIVIRPKVPYRWLDYLGWALAKTSLRLPIYIEHNLREEHYPYDPFWVSTFLDAKTFEEEIGVCEDCYSVLQKLLGETGFVTQHEGNWWIVRVDEIDSRNRYVFSVTPDLSTWVLHNDTYDKTIKRTEDIKWIERSAYVQLDRPHSHIKEQYNFDYPKEIIDNINFERGNFNGVISVGPDESAFHLDDWEVVKNAGSITSTAYIKRRYFNDYEKERFVVFTPQSSTATPWDYIKPNPVPVITKDKASVSVDFRWASNWTGTGTTTHFMMTIWIEVGPGDYWYYKQDSNSWTHTVILSNWYCGMAWDSSVTNETEWQTLSIDLPPMPADGDLYIGLLNGRQSGSFDNVDMHYQNLQFTYEPFINGSYRKFSGQHWKIEQPGEYKAVRETDIYLTDSPRRLFKGAMMYVDAVTNKYKLSSRFYDYSLSPTMVAVIPSVLYEYGWFQAQSVWNQYRRVMRIFDGEMLGLTEDDLPDLIHRYILVDPSPHTRLRYFLCLHYTMSLKTCRWTAYFAEVFKTDEEKVYDDSTEFKFIESR